MKVNDEMLLRSGFNGNDLFKVKTNVARYGGTLEEAIQDLANRFRIILWVFYFCLALFIGVALTSDRLYMFSAAISILVIMLIVVFIQPPVLSYKSWRYWKKNGR